MINRIRNKLKTEEIVPLKYTEELKISYFSGSVTGGSLKNKTVLITGANGGIGIALCLRYAKEGCKVNFTTRTEEKCNNVYRKLKKAYPKGSYKGYLLDLCDEESIKQFVIGCGNNIDILINNAGILTDIDRNGFFRKVEISQFEKIYNTNLMGMKNLTDEIVGKMEETGKKGIIINISSICALCKNFQYTPYGISKSGVLSYTKKLKLKHPEYNIHAITPGSVATGMVGYRTGDDLSYRKNILLRVALPEEIAALSAFLSSDCGKHISNLIVTAAAGEIL